MLARLKLLGIEGSTSIKLVETAIKGLSAEEAASKLITTGLTDAERVQTLVELKLCKTG